MQPSTKTTVGAGTAGAAIGVLVTWALGAFTGVDVSPEAGGALSTLGAFVFGLIFPTR